MRRNISKILLVAISIVILGLVVRNTEGNQFGDIQGISALRADLKGNSFAKITSNEKDEIFKMGGYQLPLAVLDIDGSYEDFYGDESGILVAGRQFKEYEQEQIAEGIWEEPVASDFSVTLSMPANFNELDWIREAKVKLSDSEGNVFIDDYVGVRVSGNASRKLQQKSLQLIFAPKYGSATKGLVTTTADGRMSYVSQIRVHASGQDLRLTQLRHELITEMLSDVGLEYIEDNIPVIVRINGEFYGLAHLEEAYNAHYIADKYGLDEKHIEIFKGGIEDAAKRLGYSNSEAKPDFNDVKIREDIESKIDIDDFIKYYSFNCLIKNFDWPQNNIVMWRYTGDTDVSKPYTDGRYRFAVYDVDVCFQEVEGLNDPLDELNYGEGTQYHQLFRSIMEYRPYRDKFVNALMDQMTIVLSDDNYAAAKLAEIESDYGDAFRFAYDNTRFPQVKGYLEHHDENVKELIDNISKRRQKICDTLYQYYDSGEGYYLTIVPAEGVTIKTYELMVTPQSNSITSIRANGVNVPVVAEVQDGYTFKGFLINGTLVEDEDMKIDISDSTCGGDIEITAIAEK